MTMIGLILVIMLWGFFYNGVLPFWVPLSSNIIAIIFMALYIHDGKKEKEGKDNASKKG